VGGGVFVIFIFSNKNARNFLNPIFKEKIALYKNFEKGFDFCKKGSKYKYMIPSTKYSWISFANKKLMMHC
jgi:hypothetical protein